MMWNPREHIEDLMATGLSQEEAVAETRAYAAQRREIQRKTSREAARRREQSEERPPMFLTHLNRQQRAALKERQS